MLNKVVSGNVMAPQLRRPAAPFKAVWEKFPRDPCAGIARFPIDAA